MSQNIEINQLISNACHPTFLTTDIDKFQKIADLLKNRPNLCKDFARALKLKLSSEKHPKVQFLLFDLIEYTTCKCTQPLINEYNSKSFLQIINSVFNQNNLPDEVKYKGLMLIQFWNIYFQNKKDLYPNFAWYHNTIVKKGINFPPFVQSNYIDSQPTLDQKSNSNSIIANFNEKQEKLFKDLCVVIENINLANQLITEKDLNLLGDVMLNIKVMSKKVSTLPEILAESGEGFLMKLALAIREDMAITIDRYKRLNLGVGIARFESRSEQIIKEGKADANKRPNNPFSPGPMIKEEKYQTNDFKPNSDLFSEINDFSVRQENSLWSQPQVSSYKENKQKHFGEENDFENVRQKNSQVREKSPSLNLKKIEKIDDFDFNFNARPERFSFTQTLPKTSPEKVKKTNLNMNNDFSIDLVGGNKTMEGQQTQIQSAQLGIMNPTHGTSFAQQKDYLEEKRFVNKSEIRTIE